MLIERMHPESVPLLPTPSQPSSPSSSAQNPQNEKQRIEEPVTADQVLFSGREDARLGEIRSQKERLNSTAAAIRETDRAADVLGQKIDALKEPLQAIVKNFPPFSAQDKERVELLRSYTALRKEIDQLTIPAPPSVVEARKQVVLPDPLVMTADDSQIADHVDELDATARALTTLKSDIAADTIAILQTGRFYSIFAAPKGAREADSGVAFTESAAAQKSAEVGRQFAESVRQGVTVQHPQFLKGLS